MFNQLLTLNSQFVTEISRLNTQFENLSSEKSQHLAHHSTEVAGLQKEFELSQKILADT